MQGQARFDFYQKLLALGFATVQAVGQLSLLRPYVDDWSAFWLYSSTVTLVAGSSVLVYVRGASCCRTKVNSEVAVRACLLKKFRRSWDVTPGREKSTPR